MTMVLYCMRMIGGHAHEAHEFFNQQYRPLELVKLTPHLDDRFYRNVKTFHKLATDGRFLNNIRNKLSFHTDATLLCAAFDAVPEGYWYEALLCNEPGHNIFYGSETLMIEAAPHIHESGDWETSIAAAFREPLSVAQLIYRIFHKVIHAIFVAYFNVQQEDAEELDLPVGPPINEVLIPFFSTRPNEDNKVDTGVA
jgi:hypothetical protein